MFGLNRIVLLRRLQHPKVKTSCGLVMRNFRASGRQCVEVPNFMGFLSNTESDKMQQITQEVSKQQVLADEDEDDDMEEMFIMGPSQGKVEWGGPTRGGVRPEPTRYGDWERKGRVTDF